MIAAGAGTVSRFVSENEQGQSDINVVSSTHVETVVLLSHKKADSYIHIDVEFGEGEGKIPVDSIAKRAEAYKPKEKGDRAWRLPRPAIRFRPGNTADRPAEDAGAAFR